MRRVVTPAVCVLAVACNRAGDPPPWWFDRPIPASMRCSTAHHATPPSSPTLPESRRAPEAIQRRVRSHYGAVRACYERLLARRMPGDRGVVSVRFVIDRDGSVANACIVDSTLDDRDLARCVLAEFMDIGFGASDGVTTVVYPIRFSPGP